MQDSVQVTTSIVTVERIKPEDHTCVLALQPHSHQLSYVASNAASLEEADENPAFTSVIRALGEPVGFAMYALDEDDGNYWVYRLMIDARFQGMGYGRAALSRIIQKHARVQWAPRNFMKWKALLQGAESKYTLRHISLLLC
ncbi:N-acetyltransferase [Ensifer adhaerens]|uniref:GNAT family N-acetyltransferase n=1 Tax=Ensifer canadensis TaxID=555315 RepID=UPI00148F4D5B|nr:GNAT family N-acetyltransferase [Ensifer canadensis]NOV21196.1 N-acetyltransferase [Ensifer canadensis]